MSHEEAARLPKIIGKQHIIDYATVVFNLIVEALEDVKLDDLYIPVKADAPKPPLLIEDVLFLINHGGRHLGMIEALIGVVFEREGTASI